ncbi:helix-turn-helix domain-containing protein [Planctomycetota bacterium]
MMNKFANNLKKIRQSKSLSQSDMAKRTGLHPAAISHFETGERKPSLDNLIRLADALSVSTDFLLERDVARASSATGKLFRDFEKLPHHDQEVIQDMVRCMLRKGLK